LKIKVLGEDIDDNAAYTPEQIVVIKPAIIAKDVQLWLYVTFMLLSGPLKLAGWVCL
jgi:hypothetical protein